MEVHNSLSKTGISSKSSATKDQQQSTFWVVDEPTSSPKLPNSTTEPVTKTTTTTPSSSSQSSTRQIALGSTGEESRHPFDGRLSSNQNMQDQHHHLEPSYELAPQTPLADAQNNGEQNSSTSSSSRLTGRKVARSLRIFRHANNDDEGRGSSEYDAADVSRVALASPLKEQDGVDVIDLEPVSSATYIPHTPAYKGTTSTDKLDSFRHLELEDPRIPTSAAAPQHLTANVEFDHSVNGNITNFSTILNNELKGNKSIQQKEVEKIEKIIHYSRASTPADILERETGALDNTVVLKDQQSLDKNIEEFPLPVELRPFKNKVGGHTAIFKFSTRAVCKVLVNRENIFYESVEIYHPELLRFMPRYIGVLNVRYSSMVDEKDVQAEEKDKEKEKEDGKEDRKEDEVEVRNEEKRKSENVPEVVLDDNKHIIPDTLWKQYSSSFPSPKFSSLGSTKTSPVPSLTNSPVQRPNQGATLVNTELQVQVLQEVFLPTFKSSDDGFFNMDEELHRSNHHHHHHNHHASNQDHLSRQNSAASMTSLPRHPFLRKHTRFERFILLEDLTSNMSRPCVLDLKMGTRQYGIEASAKKQKSQRRKCFVTTSRQLGVRVCGLQIFTHDNHFLVKDKYFGRRIKAGVQFCKVLAKFLYNGKDIYSILFRVIHLINQFNELHSIFSAIPGYRMYGSSVLLMYEGGGNAGAGGYDQVQVKIIDFAQSVSSEEEIEHAHIPPLHPHDVDLGYLRGLYSLIQYCKYIFHILSETKIDDTDKMQDWIDEHRQLLDTNCLWLDDYAEVDNQVDGGINDIDANDPFNIDYSLDYDDNNMSE
ncbi:uncharacterized protein LODBEIA_P14620 [Lodderomyces beijingensis]|uniref:Kinase n=1 Tax=Lodderomyces beijingensis TaxID=1775926 RepID=A0ABP0ZGE5_9ASCO